MTAHTSTTESETITYLSARMLEIWQERDPFRAGPFGYPAASRLLPAYGEAAVSSRTHALAQIATQARAVDESALSEQEQITRSILIEQAESAAELLAADTESFTVNLPREFSTAAVVRGMTKSKVTDDLTGSAQLARLRALPQFMDTDLALLERGAAQGRASLKRALDTTLEELTQYLATPLRDDPLVGVCVDGWSGAEAWRVTATSIVEDMIRPAATRFIEGVQERVLPQARADDKVGLCWLPDGESVYNAFLREEITMTPDPHVMHESGRTLMVEMREKLSELGEQLFGISDATAVLAHLRHDDSLAYASEDAALTDGQARMARTEALLPKWFGEAIPPCPVEPMPAATARHYGGGQYMPGTADGSRNGVFYINTTGRRFRHEVPGMVTGGAVPGSHIFWSYAFAADVPAFRKVAFVPAFVKGWASYGSQLAYEMGLFDDPVSEIGYWAKQAANVCRQVVDTGVHALGWSWDVALAYLLEHTALSQRDSEVELSRIVAMPGEGPIFTFGGQQITQARRDAEALLGDRFNIAEFHDALLRNGAMPLDTMKSMMDGWAQDRAN